MITIGREQSTFKHVNSAPSAGMTQRVLCNVDDLMYEVEHL